MSNQSLLNQIAEEARTCKKCGLHECANNAVPGEGNPKAEIMLIGEAPGKREDLTGRPFIGSAGKLLDSVLEKAGLKRKDIFIGNIAKHRPPDNRAPKPDEIEACTPYLDRQIKIIRPKIIVTLGTHSTKYILEKAGLEFTTISEARGKVFDGSALGAGIKIVPSFHPAAVIYNRKLGKTIEDDFKMISKLANR
ncbi:MAG: type-4 uracil-DNA glycosylase [Candidatus Aenigmatarchaeota archaeon]